MISTIFKTNPVARVLFRYWRQLHREQGSLLNTGKMVIAGHKCTQLLHVFISLFILKYMFALFCMPLKCSWVSYLFSLWQLLFLWVLINRQHSTGPLFSYSSMLYLSSTIYHLMFCMLRPSRTFMDCWY